MVAITRDALSSQHLHEAMQCVQREAAGAVVTFHGTVRNSSHGQTIEYLEYEAYRPMAEREMGRIIQKAEEDFAAQCAAIHRVGKLQVGETSVIVAASSAHRTQAFEACRFVMDSIKKSVPIWKKEVAQDGAWWVEDPMNEKSQA
jgi:molybdopterin synthase catalytic subunit